MKAIDTALYIVQEIGWSVFPCHEKPWSYQDKSGATIERRSKDPYWQKGTLEHGFKDASKDPEQIKRWWAKWPDAYIGIPCRANGFFVIDQDVKNGAKGRESWQAICTEINDTIIYGPSQLTPSGGAHFLFKDIPEINIPNNVEKLAPGLDIRSAGYICTGGDYTWAEGHGPKTPLPDAPDYLITLIKRMIQKNDRPIPAGAVDRRDYSNHDNYAWADSMLRRLSISRADNYEDWVNVGMALSELGAAGLQLWDNWSKNSPKYKGECERKFDGFKPGAGITLGSLYYWANQDDPGGSSSPERRIDNEPPPPEITDDDWEFLLGNPVMVAGTTQEDDSGHVTAPEIEKPGRFTIRDAAWALEPKPPIQWMVDSLITEGSLTVVYGEPGCKKTWSMLSLAVNMALGLDWLDMETAGPLPVLIIDEESGERRLAIRLSHAIRGIGGDETLPIYFISLANFKMDDAADPQFLKLAIEQVGARVVIVDALADIMSGDENSKEETQPVMQTLRRLAEQTGAAVIVIHHANKTGGYRGSSAIKGSVDTLIKVESENGSAFVNYMTEKVRDGESKKFSAQAKWEEDRFILSTIETEEKKRKLSAAQRYVIQYLQKHGDSSMLEIMANADVCSDGAARKAVYYLAAQYSPLVQRSNPGEMTSKTNPARFRLTEDGVHIGAEL